MPKLDFPVLDWITGEGHAAETADLKGIKGTIRRIDIKITSVTDNPTVNVALSDYTDSDFDTNIVTFSGLADGTLHIKYSDSHKGTPDGDFNPIPCSNSTLRISVDPSADPGGAAQTLTVTVSVYVEPNI